LGDRRVFVVLFGIVLLLVIPLSLDATVFADDDDDDDDDKKKYKHDDDDDDYDDKKHTTKIIHLGFLQLAAHDFFNMKRCLVEDDDGNLTELPEPPLPEGCQVDSENGKLDLSTVLFNPLGELCDFEKSLKGEGDCALYDGMNGGDIAKWR